MSDKIKCPFCGAELVSDPEYLHSEHFHCENPECIFPSGVELHSSVWHKIIDGKKAQDALKVAISALGLIGNGKSDEQGFCRFVDERNCENVRTISRNALTKITSITKQEARK